MIGGLCFRINDNCTVKLYAVGMYNQIDWDDKEDCELGERFSISAYKDPDEERSFVKIEKGIDGEYILRLVETKRYIIKVSGDIPDNRIFPQFQNEGNKFLKIDRDSDSVFFQFVNYLGRTKITFDCGEDTIQLPFEVIPDKIDYEDDYIKMTEDIAEVCSELLLEYSGSTSNMFEQTDDDPQTLLEQFIFLRQFCYSQNIQSLFQSIKRNPDRVLVQEESYRPFGTGIPASKFYTNPFSHSKNWRRVGTDGSFMPQDISVTSKRDSLDTPANRFIRYALEKFDNICLGLIDVLSDKSGGDEQVQCFHEAQVIHWMLEDIFRDPFFEDVGMPDIMPQNNQVLQKREGYSQIFSAYSMTDLALKLNWKGKEAVYEGESKNVALLYEYWLFFELYKMIRSIEGCEALENTEQSFISHKDGEVIISLEQDKKSCQPFVIKKFHTKINLYYNRTFSPLEFTTTRYEGSYSRPFRPDYTIAIFPDSYSEGKYNGEQNAVYDGVVSYVHFDAKYRISDLTGFIGHGDHTGLSDDTEEVIEDKRQAVTNTYQRGDLLKMHTYNDAIRRTIGSYVLYPGAGNSERERQTVYRLYDEILPGVGAFAMKPGNIVAGRNELRKFIVDLLEAKGTSNSRLNRLRYYSEIILHEPSIASLDMRKSGVALDKTWKDKIDGKQECIIGYIRAGRENSYYESLERCGAFHENEEFIFYFYAIKGTNVYAHHKDIFKARYFRFYTNNIGETNTYNLRPVLCSVEANELMSKGELVNRLNNRGLKTSEEEHYADFYYVLTVKVIDDSLSRKEINVSDVNSQNGNDTFSPHSPKIIKLSQVNFII